MSEEEQKHTAEPWLVEGLMGTDSSGMHALFHCGVGLRHGSYIKEQEANARRIVACVNACAGISTELLKDRRPLRESIISAESKIEHLWQQRDALLAANIVHVQ